VLYLSSQLLRAKLPCEVQVIRVHSCCWGRRLTAAALVHSQPPGYTQRCKLNRPTKGTIKDSWLLIWDCEVPVLDDTR
jgi:hypothetical protein